MKIRFYLSLIFLFAGFQLFAQNTLNADSLYKVAQNNAVAGLYEVAIKQCDSILTVYPEYLDVKILKARIYGWNKNYAAAQETLEKNYKAYPNNLEIISALTDNFLWSDQAENAIEFATKGLQIDSNNVDLNFKKARAEFSLKQYKNAEKTLQKLQKLDSTNTQLPALMEEVKLAQRLNTLSLYNLHDWFGETYGQRNLTSLEYKRQTIYGPALARVNYASRFGLNETQYELDFYPKISNQFSGYLNYGFSPAKNLFPQHKIGYELFYTHNKSFTASAGVRHLFFPSRNLSSYTASGIIYRGKYSVGMRVYLTPTSEKMGESIYAFIRRSIINERNYITLSVSQAVSPETTANTLNLNSFNNENFYFINSQSAKIQLVKTIYQQFSLQLGTEFTRLQSPPFDSNTYIFQFTLDTGLKFQF